MYLLSSMYSLSLTIFGEFKVCWIVISLLAKWNKIFFSFNFSFDIIFMAYSLLSSFDTHE